MNHNEVARRFNRAFGVSHQTVMIGGAPEPLYVPGERTGGAAQGGRSIIRYREDFTLSALHEVAHWCIASRQRRRCRDYGYWYSPPPRHEAAQQSFFAAEVRVQALESLFAATIGVRFRVSADNVGTSSTGFAEAVVRAACEIESAGLSLRANQFRTALLRTGNSDGSSVSH